MAIAVASAAAHSYAHTECETAYARARERTEQITDAPELPHVLVGPSVSYDTTGDLASARDLAQQTLEIERGQGAKGWELRAATSLARLWRRQGKLAEARTVLRPVYDWFTEGFDAADLKDARALYEPLA